MANKPIPTPVKIQLTFREYRKELRDIWESYNLVDFYMSEIHTLVKSENIGLLPLTYLTTSGSKTYSKQDTFGAISHLRRKANPRRSLVDAVAAFENYVSHLVLLVYRDYPGKLLTQEKDQTPEQSEQSTKLLKLIVDSSDRNEMLEKIIEEKIRGIFYGKPTDFFLKDKAKLEFASYFKDNYAAQLAAYSELTARRNLLAHNGGKVDRKYLREVKGSPFKVGQQIPLSTEYIRTSIALLEGLSAAAASLVLQNIYKQAPRGHLTRSLNSFVRTLSP